MSIRVLCIARPTTCSGLGHAETRGSQLRAIVWRHRDCCSSRSHVLTLSDKQSRFCCWNNPNRIKIYFKLYKSNSSRFEFELLKYKVQDSARQRDTRDYTTRKSLFLDFDQLRWKRCRCRDLIGVWWLIIISSKKARRMTNFSDCVHSPKKCNFSELCTRGMKSAFGRGEIAYQRDLSTTPLCWKRCVIFTRVASVMPPYDKPNFIVLLLHR